MFNVLSLFDGISCGRVALERARIPIHNYFASEIAQKSIYITMKNYPNTIQLGDVIELDVFQLDKLPSIDILIGGSPCQDLSIYKFDRGDVKGLDGDKSRLFYHYERILKYMKPTYFLLENVPMLKDSEHKITEILEVEPIMINSNLVTAADRKRLYWTNIPNITQPNDKGIVLEDIVFPSNEVPKKYWYDKPFIYQGDNKKVQCILGINGHDRLKEVYNLNGKSNTIMSDGDGGNRVKKVYQDGRCRKLMPIEYERLQNLDDNYTSGICDSARYSAIGNGFTVDVLTHIFKKIPLQNFDNSVIFSDPLIADNLYHENILFNEE